MPLPTHTYEPIPGLVVEYTYHPEQKERLNCRWEDATPPGPAWVEVETITIGGVDEHEWPAWLSVDSDRLAEKILEEHFNNA